MPFLEAHREDDFLQTEGSALRPEGTFILCDCCLGQKPLSEFNLRGHWHICCQCLEEFEEAYAKEEVSSLDDFICHYVTLDELEEGSGWC